MASAWPPSRDAVLAVVAPQVAAKLVADPAAYGESPADAAQLSALAAAWVAAYRVSADPATRTRAAVAAKNQARGDVRAALRSLNARVQAQPTVSTALKESLGLPIRKPWSRIPPPATAPRVHVVAAYGNTVRLRLSDPASPTRRAKPPAVYGAYVYSFVGETDPPAALADWQNPVGTTLTTCTVPFRAVDVSPGTRVWFCARWINRKQQPGPASAPVPTRLPGGIAQAA